MNSDPNKKYKKPKRKTLATTNPETSTSQTIPSCDKHSTEQVCPLQAKDSEWVDILQSSEATSTKLLSEPAVAEEEEVLQLVECEDGPELKPLAIMFPGLLDKDPQTLHGMLNKAMSTTEVTRQLVNLGQKANFTFMKKADKLIPPDKKWLESVRENSNSIGSLCSKLEMPSASNYDASDEVSISESKTLKNKKKLTTLPKVNPVPVIKDTEKLEYDKHHSEDDST